MATGDDDGLELVAETLFRQTGNVFFQKYKVVAAPNDEVWLWFHPNGRMYQRMVKRCGKLYCETGPALERWYRDGSVKLVAWFPFRNAPLPPDAPYHLRYHPNGVLESEYVRVHDDYGEMVGVKHTKWYDNGQRRSRKHFSVHKEEIWLSRQGGKPALRKWFRSGGVAQESYYVDANVIRDAGQPCHITYYASGRPKITQERVGRRMIHHEYYASGVVKRVICFFRNEHDKGYASHDIRYARDGSVVLDVLTVNNKRIEPDKAADAVRELIEAETPAQTPTCPTS